MKTIKPFELTITEEIKIKRHDNYNFELLIKNTAKSNIEGKEIYELVGFYDTIKKALYGVLRHDLLVDLEQVKSLRDYKLQVDKQHKTIETLLKDDLKE